MRRVSSPACAYPHPSGCMEGGEEMIKDEGVKEPTYEHRPGQWIEVDDVPHPPKWLWKFFLWLVFIVGLVLGVVLAG